MQPLLTPQEAMRTLKVSRNTLAARVRDGVIERVNVNPQGQRPTWRYKLPDLENPEERLKWLDLKRRCGL